MSEAAHRPRVPSASPSALRPPRLLIIHADDLGYCTARDDAIFNLHVGITRFAISEAPKAIDRARSSGLHLSLHLNLTEGLPLARDVSSLRGTDGQMLGKVGFRSALHEGRLSRDDITTEIREQLAQYLAATSSQPHLHVDGHQHVHVLEPVASILATEMRRTGRSFSVRIPHDESFLNASIPEERKGFMQTVVKDAAASRRVYDAHLIFAAHGFASSEAFIGQGLMGAASTLANLDATLANAEPKSVEWMVHPGFADPSYGDDFNRSPDREVEYATLRSPELRECISRYGFRLGGWHELSEEL